MQFFSNLHYAMRQLRRSPAFAFAAILTLTLGIGLNVVIFGALNALLLNPLPVPEAGQIYGIQENRDDAITLSYPNYRDIRDHRSAFSDVALVRIARIAIDRDNSAMPVWGYEVSGNYFDTLGIKPAVGNFFHATDEHGINGSPYAVLSYKCWRTRFGSDPNIAGRSILLNKLPYTILGVAPENFNGTERFIWPELWVPVLNEPQIEGYDWISSRYDSNGWLIGRLKTGSTAAQADAELQADAAWLARTYPEVDKDLTLHVVKPGLLGNSLGKPLGAFLVGFMSIAGLALVAACANVGSLYAARMADRARELSLRIALGSSRLRIVHQLLTEAVLVAVIGGLAASLLAATALIALSRFQAPIDFPAHVDFVPGVRVFMFSLLLALMSGVFFGCIPVRRIWQTDPNVALRGTPVARLGGRSFSLRDALLVLETMICCFLVTASLVCFRGFARALHTQLGIDPQGVTLAVLDIHLANYKDEDVPVIQRRLLDKAAALPGITAAAFSNSTPLSVDQSSTGIYPAGTKGELRANLKFFATDYQISPGYLQATGTRLLAGRDFTWHDAADSPPVALINQTFALKLFGSQQVISRYFVVNDHEVEVAGLVGDGKYTTVSEDPTPVIFFPILQHPNSSTVLMVRSSLPSAAVIPALRRAIAEVDSGLPVFSIGNWQSNLESLVLLPARVATIVLGALSALVIMLSATGIFGLTNYTVSGRMKELGIRVALGAQRREVLQTVLGKAALLLGIGSLIGLAIALAANSLIGAIVYQATIFDPSVIATAIIAMLFIGLASTVVPARRALAVNPARLLREE